MKIEKYLLCLDRAVSVITKRMRLQHTPTSFALRVLSTLKRRPMRAFAIVNYINGFSHLDNKRGVMYAFTTLLEDGLIEVDAVDVNHKTYSITPKGREFMSMLRRYMLHIRIS